MDINNLDFNSFMYFYKLAQTKNFTETAKHFKINSSSVHRRIKQLEEDLKVRLYTVNDNTVTITTAGLKLMAIIQRNFFNLEFFKSTSVKNDIIIGIDALVGDSILWKYLPSLIKAFPDVNISCITGTFETLEAQLMNNQIHLILSYNFEIQNSYVVENIIAPLEYVIVSKTALNSENFSQPYLEYSKYFSKYFSEKITLINMNKVEVVGINDYGQILEILNKGVGFSILPKRILTKQYKDLLTYTLPSDDWFIRLCYHQNFFYESVMKKMIAIIKEGEYHEFK